MVRVVAALLHPFLAMLAAWALLVGAAAQAAPTDPKLFIEDLSKTVIEALSRGAPKAERERLFTNLFETHVDLEGVGRFVLGRHYRTATPDQLQRYNVLFKDFVVLTYAIKLGDYAGQRMVIKNANVDGEVAVVPSAIERVDGPPILVDWKVKNVGGALRIIDVGIEGVSMAQSQREDFSAVIQSGGGNIEALLTKLAEQNVKLKAPN